MPEIPPRGRDLAVGESRPIPRARSDRADAQWQRACVLVIDDDRGYRELIRRNLALRGHRALLAPNGRTGLALLERGEIDLTIVDPVLPDVDGSELCRRIRDLARVPFIIVSARADEAAIVRGLKLGADDYVAKPFGAEELVARVEAVVRRGRPGWPLVTPPI